MAIDKPSFGTLFTDHMFVMEWQEDKGWHNQRIQPYQNFSINPASANLHYGQEIFEGIKAFMTHTGNIALFRPRDHLERMNRSAQIMCMPEINVDEVVVWLKKLVTHDVSWVPTKKGSSLYIRPTMIATEKSLEIKPSSQYCFFIILSPVQSPLYEFKPLPILVSDTYTRASSGGVGQAKAAGNYAASMRAQKEAQSVGCTQVLWLDPHERTFVEEVGTMNIFFVINNTLITPALTDSILAGITRLSIIELCKQYTLPVQECHISIHNLISGIQDGTVQEIFGSGTAAVIAPIGSLRYKNALYTVNNNRIGAMTQKLFTMLTDIQYGISKNENKWLELIP